MAVQPDEADYGAYLNWLHHGVSVGYALMLAGHLGLDDRFPQAVQAYWQRLQQRPAYQQALAAQRAAALAQGVPELPSPELPPPPLANA